MNRIGKSNITRELGRGAILYELLTFQRAFPGDNVTTVIYRIMHETPPPPRTFDQTLSTGLDAVLGAALAKDPTQRYQSGRALADHLRNHKQFERAEDEATVVTMPGAAGAALGHEREAVQAAMRPRSRRFASIRLRLPARRGFRFRAGSMSACRSRFRDSLRSRGDDKSRWGRQHDVASGMMGLLAWGRTA